MLFATDAEGQFTAHIQIIPKDRIIAKRVDVPFDRFFRNFFKDFLSARRCARVWQTFA